MDAFYACVPYRRKRRIHFHHFMMEVHNELKTLTNATDPLITVAERIAQKTRLLCFDEFHVSDIADAMILGRLMKELFERGVICADLQLPARRALPQWLAAHQLLPAIELLKNWLTVLNVDGGNDYRLRELTPSPCSSPAERQPRQAGCAVRALVVWHRQRAQARNYCVRPQNPRHPPLAGAIWFDFMEICGGPRAQTDYLEIAREYQTVFVSNVPSWLRINPARRAVLPGWWMYFMTTASNWCCLPKLRLNRFIPTAYSPVNSSAPPAG